MLLRVLILLCCFLTSSFSALSAEDEVETPPKTPNVVLIVTDDQRYDDLDGVMPKTLDSIVARGIRFNRAYITTPACCPSRASILTGEYASGHTVRGNRFKLLKKTFVEYLHEAGFYTGLVGKYLNSWDGSKRPEYDYWVSFRGGGADFNDPVLNVQGNFRVDEGYITDVLHGYATEFISSAVQQEKPFFLHLNYNAPHWPAIPSAQDHQPKNLSSIPRNPNFNEHDRSDKPKHISSRSAMTKGQMERELYFRQRQRETLQSVDRSIEALVEQLTEAGVIENTAIFFISDNGVFAGEHALTDKDAPYEAAVKVPCALRYDGIVNSQISDSLVANIDIAPTIMDIVGLEIPASMDGDSWLKLLDSNNPWRSEILLEDFVRRGNKRPFVALVTDQFLFVRNQSSGGGVDRNRLELYDLDIDPYQMRNLANVKSYYNTRSDLRERLDALLYNKRGSLSFRQPKGLMGQRY